MGGKACRKPGNLDASPGGRERGDARPTGPVDAVAGDARALVAILEHRGDPPPSHGLAVVLRARWTHGFDRFFTPQSQRGASASARYSRRRTWRSGAGSTR